jgi:hypothetical protein
MFHVQEKLSLNKFLSLNVVLICTGCYTKVVISLTSYNHDIKPGVNQINLFGGNLLPFCKLDQFINANNIVSVCLKYLAYKKRVIKFSPKMFYVKEQHIFRTNEGKQLS